MGLFTILNTKKTIKKYSSNSIVIFSEDDIYYTTNKPIIDELINMVNVLYITIDKNDKLLEFKHEKFHPIFLEFSFFGKLVLGALKGKLFVTTTPSLNIIPLMKSPFMQQYIYIMHSPTDIHYYQRYSDVTVDMASNSVKLHKIRTEPWKVTMLYTGQNTMTGSRIKKAQEL